MQNHGYPTADGTPGVAGIEKQTSFVVTNSIPGIAAKDELIRVNDHGILIGRWLPLDKYDELMRSRHLLRVFTGGPYSTPTRPPRQPRA
jgi:hypothetical protein